DRRYLGGSAAHEDLVGEIEVGADQVLLDDAVPEILWDLDHGVARESRQDRRGEVRRVHDTVLDDEDVLSRAVGDVTVLRQQDRLLVPGTVRLRNGEHRVDVDAGRLRDVR